MFVDPRYPPKNRSKDCLGPIEIKIEDAGGPKMFDPNSLVMAVAENRLVLGGTVGPSVLSGRPGYRFCEDDIAAILTKDEIDRMVDLDLRPDEYFKLRQSYGLFFLIHDDFYDVKTGAAEQPRHLREAWAREAQEEQTRPGRRGGE